MAKAAFITGPRQAEVRPVDTGAVGPKQVRTHTLFSGFSHGTEMNIYRGLDPSHTASFDRQTRLFLPELGPGLKPPFRYGYANVSEVVECGQEVDGLNVGDRVFGAGGHQTELVVDAARLVKLPAQLDPRVGIFIANVTTTFNGTLDAGIRLGETVAIIGQGVLGQLLSQFARLSGAGQVIVVDLIQKRLDMGLALGADVAINARETQDVALEIRRLTDNRGADVVFEVSASYAGLQEAIRSVAPRSTVVAMSAYPGPGTLTLGSEFHLNAVNVRCSQVGTIAPELAHRWSFPRRQGAAVKLLSRLRLAELITHFFPFDEASAAYEIIDQHPEEVIQVILSY